MELRHLRYFVAVAEERSFTAAAARLGVSQPPLSQQIRDLERELSTDLLARTSRTVRLTEAGAAFLDQARAILEQAARASAQARAIGRGQVGTLEIGLTGSVLLGPLSALIAAFRARNPLVSVRLHEMSPDAQQEAVRARRADVSFLRSPTEGAELVIERAWAERVGVALPARHPLAARRRLGLADLRDEDFAFLRLADSRFAQYLRDCCIDAGFAPRIAQEVVEAYSLISLVAAGFGVALVPEYVSGLVRPGVVYRRLAPPAPSADVQMIVRPDHGPVVASFLTFARAFLRKEAAA